MDGTLHAVRLTGEQSGSDPRPPVQSSIRIALRQLFPEAPDRPVVLPAVLIGLFAVVMAAGMMLARQPGIGALDTMYAEDGSVFVQQAIDHGLVDALRQPYQGYVHVVPRLLAEVALLLPIRDAAAAMALEAAILVGLLALVVFRAATGHILSTAIRVILAVSMVAAPVAQEEVLNNVANLHWYFLFASVWVLLWVPRSRWEVLVGALVLVLAALSDPLAVLLLPLAGARVWARGRPHAEPFVLALVAGLAGQFVLIVVATATRETAEALPGALQIAHWYAFYVVGRGVFGERAVARFGEATGAALAVIAVVMVGAIGVFALVRRVRTAMVVSVLGVMSLLFYVMPLLLTGNTPPRYTLVPVLLLFSMVACAVDGLGEAMPRIPQRGLEAVLIVVLVFAWSTNFRVANRRAGGPRWSQEVVMATDRCRQGQLQAVDVPITPVAPEGWKVTVPCERLTSSG